MLIIETAINRYLALDPELLDKLSVFKGKVIKLEITVVDKELYMFPDDNGIQFSAEYEGQADTVLRG
ncbi:MAG: hypothetical protein GQ550_09040 [Gammaproteobacteria bacterium]|nr:hypothetical protein [Gammaproteobacteria bacterium]